MATTALKACLTRHFCIITLYHCNISDGTIHQIYLATLLIHVRIEWGAKKNGIQLSLQKENTKKIFAQNSAENAGKSTLSEWIVHFMKTWSVVLTLISRNQLTQSSLFLDFLLNFDFLVSQRSWWELMSI